MHNIRHITFTGISPDTDLRLLREIQERHPLAEWGVLIARNWKEKDSRYYDPDLLDRLQGQGLNLSCHVCGGVAREAADNNWKPLYELTHGLTGLFRRCQLNISAQQPRPDTPFLRPPEGVRELIIQQKNPWMLDLFRCIRDRRGISVLLDASGGQGIDTPVQTCFMPGVKIGYAGGIHPGNVAGKLETILGSNLVDDFWIDMESGVRTGGAFDTDKVISVLQTCEEILKEHHLA